MIWKKNKKQMCLNENKLGTNFSFKTQIIYKVLWADVLLELQSGTKQQQQQDPINEL